jgi:hypothetical protein
LPNKNDPFLNTKVIEDHYKDQINSHKREIENYKQTVLRLNRELLRLQPGISIDDRENENNEDLNEPIPPWLMNSN